MNRLHQQVAYDTEMRRDQFLPPSGAFTRSVPVGFSHCDPAGIVYFPHYFDMFNGLIEDWYGEELGYDYARLITDSQYAFPFVHIECDFKIRVEWETLSI